MKIVSLVVMLSLPFAAAAEMYRWVDTQGKVHYSDSPPPTGAKSTKTIDTPPPAPTDASAKPKSWQEKEMEFRQRQAAEDEAQAKKEKEAKEKQQNCDIARRNLAKFEHATRVVTTNEKGEPVYMDAAARAAAAAEARKQIDTWCK